jgi:hypothetical protein
VRQGEPRGEGLPVGAVGVLDDQRREWAEERPEERIVERRPGAGVLEIEQPPAADRGNGIAGCHVAVGHRGPVAGFLDESREHLQRGVNSPAPSLPYRVEPGVEIAAPLAQPARRRRRRRERAVLEPVAAPVEVRRQPARRGVETSGEPRDGAERLRRPPARVRFPRAQQVLEARPCAEVLHHETSRRGVTSKESRRRRGINRGVRQEAERRPLVEAARRLRLESLDDDRWGRPGRTRPARHAHAPHVVSRPRLEERDVEDAQGAAGDGEQALDHIERRARRRGGAVTALHAG